MNLREWIAARFQGEETFTVERIRSALMDIPDASALTLPYVEQPGKYPYGRSVVYADDRFEAIVIHVPPGAATAVHDHGASVGCAIVAEGQLTNVLYRLRGDGRVKRTWEEAIAPGECMPSPAGVIHRMRNDGETRAVSLHVYAPPLGAMNRYEFGDANE